MALNLRGVYYWLKKFLVFIWDADIRERSQFLRVIKPIPYYEAIIHNKTGVIHVHIDHTTGFFIDKGGKFQAPWIPRTELLHQKVHCVAAVHAIFHYQDMFPLNVDFHVPGKGDMPAALCSIAVAGKPDKIHNHIFIIDTPDQIGEKDKSTFQNTDNNQRLISVLFRYLLSQLLYSLSDVFTRV